VVTFEAMYEFVDDYVLEALRGLLGQFQVEPDPAGLSVAASLLGPNSLDTPTLVLDAHARFPELQERGGPGL
jgi:hypothetical protein